MKTALVIDDNRPFADGLCQMLTLLDIQAEPAYGSNHALWSLKTTAPDYVFLDINMPGLSGFEVLRFMHREPKLTDVQVIVITSDDQEETSNRALELGAHTVLIKPITLEDLRKVIQPKKGRK